MKRILMTGAAGKLGRALSASLGAHCPVLRLSDRVPFTGARPEDEVVTAELANLDEVRSLMDGVDGVIHLGGIAGERDWQSILESNITGTYNVYEAARQAGVRRIVYASSNHATGFYGRDVKIDHTVPPLPDSRYGVSKAVGESIAALYAHKHGIGSLCIRIGNFNEAPLERRHLSIWVSPRDLTQLVRIGLEHPDIHYEVVYGVSANTRSWWDNRNAERLGYAPLDDAEQFAAGLPQEGEAATAKEVVAGRFQGGRYCVVA